MGAVVDATCRLVLETNERATRTYRLQALSKCRGGIAVVVEIVVYVES